PPPPHTLFPYTTLFRSSGQEQFPILNSQFPMTRIFNVSLLLIALAFYPAQKPKPDVAHPKPKAAVAQPTAKKSFQVMYDRMYARSEEHTSELQSRFDLV